LSAGVRFVGRAEFEVNLAVLEGVLAGRSGGGQQAVDNLAIVPTIGGTAAEKNHGAFRRLDSRGRALAFDARRRWLSEEFVSWEAF